MKQWLLKLIQATLRRLPYGLGRALLGLWAESLAKREPEEALRSLLQLQSDLDNWINQAAVRYDDGVHVKHRLTRYHDFFVERIQPGEQVLDLGCGKGELAYDLATRAGAIVTGIDLNEQSLTFAREHFHHDRLVFQHGNALALDCSQSFDTIVLSNVLEHIEVRVDFLKSLQAHLQPKRFLIRVPAIDRHWSVPLRQELGLFYFSDITHYTEYTQESLTVELAASGLAIDEIIVNWGEFWTSASAALEMPAVVQAKIESLSSL